MNDTNIIMIAIMSGLLGAAVGACLMYLSGTRPQSKQHLEDRARQAEQQLRSYQSQVTEHFTHTASLVNKLTHSYRDVHDHLTASAMQLGNVDIQPALLDGSASSILGVGAVVNAPLDYVPKKDAVVGTLSETYGLRDDVPNPRPHTETYSQV